MSAQLPEWAGAGERLVGRTLIREMRGDVPHYLPGQHRAEFLPPERVGRDAPFSRLASVTYVDVAGHAVLAVFGEDAEGWKPVAAWRAGVHSGDGRCRTDLELSERMREAIAEAEKRG